MILSNISSQTLLAGVIGDPVSQSLSPILHNSWLAQEKIDGVYIPLRIPASELGTWVKMMPDLGFRGCNVTIPHKESVIEFLDELEEVADTIGAVNTIVIHEGKRLGFNTDAFGFWQNIKPAIRDVPATLSHPVIIGAGGAARAAVFALEKAGAKALHVFARDPEKASALAEVSDNINFYALADLSSHLPKASLLVNTTPLGMQGKQMDDFTWSLHGLSQEALVTDVVYNPVNTPLLTLAKERGNPVVDGLGMLIHQALPGFEAWYSRRPQMDETIYQQLKQALIQRMK